jgi:hypothetical protein
MINWHIALTGQFTLRTVLGMSEGMNTPSAFLEDGQQAFTAGVVIWNFTQKHPYLWFCCPNGALVWCLLQLKGELFVIILVITGSSTGRPRGAWRTTGGTTERTDCGEQKALTGARWA